MITIFFFMHPYLKSTIVLPILFGNACTPYLQHGYHLKAKRRVVPPGGMLKGFILSSISQKSPKDDGYKYDVSVIQKISLEVKMSL